MNENPNRRKDDARPAVALQWGERPDQWTLLLTGPTAGVIGPLGSTWPNHPAELERVDVCVRRKDGPAVVYRTGGEGATAWHQFYPCTSAEPLRDGEYLFREGATLKPEFTHLMMLAAERAGVSFSAQQKCWRAWFDTREPRQPPKLDDSEQYRLQMAAIGTASFGYWKEGDGIHPDYDTVPLRDVARLYAKYEALHAAQRQATSALAAEVIGCFNAAEIEGLSTALAETTDARLKDLVERRLMHALYAAQQVADVPDAVDAALTDAIVHGTGAFQVKADGSTEHVQLRQVAGMVRPDVTAADFVPPSTELSEEARRYYAELAAFPLKLQRDALYQDYAVPAKPADDGGKPE